MFVACKIVIMPLLHLRRESFVCCKCGVSYNKDDYNEKFMWHLWFLLNFVDSDDPDQVCYKCEFCVSSPTPSTSGESSDIQEDSE